jgi:Fic family protein
VIRYEFPTDWIRYDPVALADELAEAKAAILSLRTIPYQREWLDTLQKMQLKREVAGTSRIEGADFTERELEAALKESPEALRTRSQRQAHAAMNAYRWIPTVSDDRRLDFGLICEIHRLIVTGADDDHCSPGYLRERDQNVFFGSPPHRGVEGGEECRRAMEAFITALQREYRSHDPLIQALAAHYHLGSMHPFLDGNGRTARAVEALLLQRAGLRDTSFIAMSNYYYDEKIGYLKALSEARATVHDLTPFLAFALKGVAIQSRRMLEEIQHHIAKALFRNLMFDLFQRLRTPRRRVIALRQIEVLKLLLDDGWMRFDQLLDTLAPKYSSLLNSRKALARDLDDLIRLGAVQYRKSPEGPYELAVRLEWPTEITETVFFEKLRTLPKAKTHSFLS